MANPRARANQRQTPAWADALRERRVQLGLSQEDISARTQDQVSQRTVSALETGTTLLEKMAVSRVISLANALSWTVQQMQEATGIDLGNAAPRTPSHAQRRGWVIPDEEPEPEIPEALQEAADRYGHGPNAALSEPRWLRELADLDFREEPETPEDWLAVYARLSKIINPK